MVGSWRSAGCSGRILMVKNFTLLFPSILKFVQNHKTKKISIKMFHLFSTFKILFSVSQNLLFLHSCLFLGMLWGFSVFRNLKWMALCTVSSENSYASSLFLSKSQWQACSFELIHRAMISPQDSQLFWYFNECFFSV